MTEAERIESLKSEHRELESKIEQESRRPAPDHTLVKTLKRQKLRIKDELASLHAL